MSYAIATHKLHYRAGKRFAIENLNLRIPEGSIYGFLGPNGAGKTTTIHLIMALLRADAGRITVLGREVPREAPAMLARVGFVPERPHLYASLGVDEILRYDAAFYSRWDRKRCDALVDGFGLDRGQRIGRLSKGETGQLMVALALARTPDLLVLDEPTDGLDPVVRRDILTALLEYVSERDATVFISSHLVHELERICDWVGVMDDGRMVADMPMQAFKEGIKRLRVANVPESLGEPPFVLLGREDGLVDGELWIVRDWKPAMREYFDAMGATLKEVVDLDLEEGFVELLRTARSATVEEAN